MPYVHYANGDVEQLKRKEIDKRNEESGTPHAHHRNGKQHAVIGVYPDELELPEVKKEDDE